MRCSVFENDEDVAGWKAGSSVAYCATCFEQKMTKEMNHEDVGHEEDFQKQTIQAEGKFQRQVSPQNRTL